MTTPDLQPAYLPPQLDRASPGVIPDFALGMLGKKNRDGLVAMAICVFFLVASIAAPLCLAWLYYRISALGHQYGWNNVPPNAMPFPEPALTQLFGILTMITIFSFYAGLLAFLLAMTAFRRGLEAIVGASHLRYGWGWTIGSVFIPIWNLYRPWVGYAEVRRMAIAAARQPYNIEPPEFDFATLLLGISYVLGSSAVVVMEIQLTVLAAVKPYGVVQVDQSGIMVAAIVIVRLIWSGYLTWYLASIWSLLEKTRIAIVELDPFS